MSTKINDQLRRAVSWIERRLAREHEDYGKPELSGTSIHFEMADMVSGLL